MDSQKIKEEGQEIVKKRIELSEESKNLREIGWNDTGHQDSYSDGMT